MARSIAGAVLLVALAAAALPAPAETDIEQVIVAGEYRYARGRRSGVHVSFDQGRTWQARGGGLPRRMTYPFPETPDFAAVTHLAADPGNPRRLAATTATGLYLTTNGGLSWQEIAVEQVPFNTYFTSVALSPHDPAGMLLGTSFHGIFETTDGGATWWHLRPVIGFLTEQALFYEEVAGLSYDPAAARAMAVLAGFDGGVYYVADRSGEGESPTPLRRYPVPAAATIQLAYAPSDEGWDLQAGTIDARWRLTASGRWSPVDARAQELHGATPQPLAPQPVPPPPPTPESPQPPGASESRPPTEPSDSLQPGAPVSDSPAAAPVPDSRQRTPSDAPQAPAPAAGLQQTASPSDAPQPPAPAAGAPQPSESSQATAHASEPLPALPAPDPAPSQAPAARSPAPDALASDPPAPGTPAPEPSTPGATEQTTVAEPHLLPAPPPLPGDAAEWAPRPEAALRNGIYLNPYRAAQALPEYLEFLNRHGLNSVVIDFKTDDGALSYDSNLALAHATGAAGGPIKLERLITQAHAAGIYVIARLVVFKDRYLYNWQDHRLAIWDSELDAPWRHLVAGDDPGTRVQREYWVDPFAPEVWEYNVAVATELAARGVDEIQFDYIRFPSDGPVERSRHRHRRPGMSRIDAIESFLALARERLEVPISTDLFGFNSWYRAGNWLGQDIAVLSEYADIISPMFYPSHFPARFLDDRSYNERAYAIYEAGVRRAQRMVQDRSYIRPYVQAFLIGRELRMEEEEFTDYLTRQLDGNRAAAGSGFTLWNASNRYYMVTSPLQPYFDARGDEMP